MKLIESSIRFPVTVVVGILIAVLGGVLALVNVPVQLTPDVDQTTINVATFWPGASPEEVEREIVEEQEEVLKSVEGLVRMSSTSNDSMSNVALEFAPGTDLDSATVRVANKLNEVLEYPTTAERPIVSSVDRFANSVAWYVLRATDENVYAPHMGTLFDELVKPQLERVSGIAQVSPFGELRQELHVVYDPDLLASMGITITELSTALRSQSADVSAGDFGEGKRRYIVRTMGRYRTLEDVAKTVIQVRAGVPIRVGDVATVELAFQKPMALVDYQGEPSIALNAQRQIGSNVLDTMGRLQETVDRLNRDVLADRGLELVCAWEESGYIQSSIDRVLNNIYLGSFLAIIILFLFLRSPTSILVVALSIPISVVTVFLVLYLLGRTVNVISLAGMAFAVGMVVDNAIVVLENIFRHLQMGKRRAEAALVGTQEVWGAVLASTLTTVAVFLPVVFIQERAGQLFRDIALAITSAISVSLIVAVTVIPSFSAKVLRAGRQQETPFLNALAARISGMVDFLNAGALRRLVTVALLVGLAVGLSFFLLPPAEYLPTGNQNFIAGFLLQPPGYNIDEVREAGKVVEELVGYLWEASDEEAAEMPGGGAKDYWYVAMREGSFFGLASREEGRTQELVSVFNEALAEVPGSFGAAVQYSLFQENEGPGTRSVVLDITGPDLDEVLDLATVVFMRIGEVLPGTQSRPIPGLDLGNPEVHVYPDRVRAANSGFDAVTLGQTVNSLIDGMKVAEYFHEGNEIDLILKGSDDWSRHTQSVVQLPLATPNGQIVTVGDIAEVRQRQGPVQINHVERQRAISIETPLPENVPLETAMQMIENEIIGPLQEEGRVGGLYNISLSGAADDLSKLRASLGMNFVIALLLTFLLLTALFQSFLYPAVIMLTVPLATCGGVLGLRLVQLAAPGQQMDVLTMLGFVILIGTVINNSILIVYQALQLTRQGEEANPAVKESVRIRVRPILMSTTTSSLGMLPLVVMPGPGSELYRGLGSVVVGGLLVSTAITLVLTPLVFTFVYETKRAFLRRWSTEEA